MRKKTNLFAIIMSVVMTAMTLNGTVAATESAVTEGTTLTFEQVKKMIDEVPYDKKEEWAAKYAAVQPDIRVEKSEIELCTTEENAPEDKTATARLLHKDGTPVEGVTWYYNSYTTGIHAAADKPNENPFIRFDGNGVATSVKSSTSREGIEAWGEYKGALFRVVINGLSDYDSKDVMGKKRCLEVIEEKEWKKLPNDIEKAKAVYDYLMDTASYSWDYKTGPYFYAAFYAKKLQCRGYSKVYRFIMEELGITCNNVIGDNGSHEWNMIQLDNEWYLLDVTGDDSDYIREYRYFLIDPATYRSYGHVIPEYYLENNFGNQYRYNYYRDNKNVATTAAQVKEIVAKLKKIPNENESYPLQFLVTEGLQDTALQELKNALPNITITPANTNNAPIGGDNEDTSKIYRLQNYIIGNVAEPEPDESNDPTTGEDNDPPTTGEDSNPPTTENDAPVKITLDVQKQQAPKVTVGKKKVGIANDTFVLASFDKDNTLLETKVVQGTLDPNDTFSLTSVDNVVCAKLFQLNGEGFALQKVFEVK